MFFGQYNYQLDEKNRVRIPSKLRKELTEGYVITKGTTHSIFIFDRQYFQDQFVAKLNNIPTFDIEAQRPIRALLSSSYEVEEDKQGKFVLPTNLKEFANINKNIVFVGVGQRLELWSEENWNKYVACDDSIDQVLGELGKYEI